jgi:general secretion pathway protein A
MRRSRDTGHLMRPSTLTSPADWGIFKPSTFATLLPPGGEGSMFLPFFGLKDNPFKLTFDVNSLFFGKHHEEALAHLRYAVAEGEGFTVITGLKGVGKSTVCRAFLEAVKGDAAVAFLSSPIPGPRELLQRMNRSFGIATRAQTTPELIDALNGFLMQARVDGKKVVVLIDDAQVLEPAVLEQIRLISNLETTREKLIQIVLIGEPVLAQLLNSHQLRQMGQRVSVRYEIGTLTSAETAAFIQHRLRVASAGPPARFSLEAIRKIHRYTRGNPRRINIACGAILTAAFKAQQKEITGELAHAVLEDLKHRDGGSASAAAPRRWPSWALACAALLLLSAAAIFALRPAPDPPPAEVPEAPGAPPQAEAPPLPEGSEPPPSPVSEVATPDPTPPVEDRPAAPPVAVIEDSPAAPADLPPVPSSAEEAPVMTHSIQIGAYLRSENAQKVADRFAAKGYPAKVTQTTDPGGRTWYTVRIGDHPSRQAAQTHADEFSSREKMESVVRPYGAY